MVSGLESRAQLYVTVTPAMALYSMKMGQSTTIQGSNIRATPKMRLQQIAPPLYGFHLRCLTRTVQLRIVLCVNMFSCSSINQSTNKQTNLQTNKQTDKQTNKQTNKQTSNQTNKQAIKQTNTQSVNQLNKQANKQTNKQTSK